MCHLCKSQSGGSTASDNVLYNISCETYRSLDATNQLGGSMYGNIKVLNVTGGKPKPKTGRKSQRPVNKNKVFKGGDDCTSGSSPRIQTTINPPSLPASVNHASIDYSTVTASVLDALKAEVANASPTYNQTTFPTSMASLKVFSMSGGSVPTCMC